LGPINFKDKILLKNFKNLVTNLQKILLDFQKNVGYSSRMSNVEKILIF